MKKQKVFSLITVMTLILSIFSESAMAAVIPPNSPQESPTLSGYSAYMEPGDEDGELIITCDVRANSVASSLGVEYIRIFESDSTYVTEITGTISNGLVKSNAGRLLKSYHFYGESGVTYYAVVKVYATIGTTSHSRVICTDDVTAP